MAYCLDEAVGMWGQFVEHEMDAAGDSAKNAKSAATKREQRMNKLLGMKQSFKTPTPMRKK